MTGRRLIAVPPPADPSYDGLDLANELLELVCSRLPQLPLNDSLRPTLHALLPSLAAACGRPPSSVAGGDA